MRFLGLLACGILAGCATQSQSQLPTSRIKPDPRIQVPRPTHSLQQPPQSLESKQRGEQGIVGLLLFVDATGKVTRSSVAKSTGYKALDDAALAVVPTWQLQPGSVGGIPTGMWSCLSLTFNPDGATYQVTPQDVEDMTAFMEVCDEAQLKLPQ